MIEKWLRLVDGGGQAGALLTDLSKAFDYIDHELLIINKPLCIRLKKKSSYYINAYLKGRKQRTKINSSYIAFGEIQCTSGFFYFRTTSFQHLRLRLLF